MSGVRAEWLAANDFIMVHRSLVEALGGDYEAAMVLDRIRYRSGARGMWVATRAEMAEETCLSEWKLKQALKHLRDLGFINSKRASAYDATLQWWVVVEGEQVEESRHPEREDSAVSEREDSAVPSTKKVRTPVVEVVGTGTDRAEPESHPSRAIPLNWAPRPAFVADLRRQYPGVDLRAACSKFTDHNYSQKRTSFSWEASFRAWVQENYTRMVEQQGTDDLGIPKGQRVRKTVALQPGDDGYVGPDDLAASAQAQ